MIQSVGWIGDDVGVEPPQFVWLLHGDNAGAPCSNTGSIKNTCVGRLLTWQFAPPQRKVGQAGHDGTPMITITQLVASLHCMFLTMVASHGPLRV